jgi:hypothetical protein
VKPLDFVMSNHLSSSCQTTWFRHVKPLVFVVSNHLISSCQTTCLSSCKTTCLRPVKPLDFVLSNHLISSCQTTCLRCVKQVIIVWFNLPRFFLCKYSDNFFPRNGAVFMMNLRSSRVLMLHTVDLKMVYSCCLSL